MTKLEKLGKIWAVRIRAAEKTYESWAERFRVNDIADYMEGKQHGHLDIPAGYRPYVLNLIESSLNVKLPEMLFDTPAFTIRPKNVLQSDDIEMAEKRAQLKEDVVNTLIQSETMDFEDTIELVLLAAFSSFGVAEVNYAADWIENPNVGKPVLSSDRESNLLRDGKVVTEPAYVPQAERVYVKYIDPKRFRVSAIQHHRLKKCEWCGYYEYIRLEDLLANKSYKQPKDRSKFAVDRSDEFSQSLAEIYDPGPEKDLLDKGDVVKVWFLWDHRSKEHIVFSEANDHIFKVTPYDYHPIHDLRLTPRLRGWYPKPPIYSWLSPQDEYNEARNMARAHRRRAVRKFTAQKGAFDPEELEKLEIGGDGTIATAKIKDPIDAVPNPPVSQDVTTSLVVTKDDFNIISGTSSDQRGQSDRTTATQASLMDRYSQIRGSKDRKKGVKFIISIGRSIIKIASSKFTLPIIVEILLQDEAKLFEEVQVAQSYWKQVDPSELQGDDYTLDIQVETLSPVTNDESKRAYLEFLAVLKNYPHLAMSPKLIKKTADMLGFKDHRVIQEFQRIAILSLIQQAQGDGLEQRQVEKSTPDAQAQIENQLGKQVGLV